MRVDQNGSKQCTSDRTARRASTLSCAVQYNESLVVSVHAERNVDAIHFETVSLLPHQANLGSSCHSPVSSCQSNILAASPANSSNMQAAATVQNCSVVAITAM